MAVALKEGISQDNAKKLSKIIRDEGPKGVRAQVQGEELRVSAKKKDDLQAVIALLKGKEFDFALQFVNYRGRGGGGVGWAAGVSQSWRWVCGGGVARGWSRALRLAGRARWLCVRSTRSVLAPGAASPCPLSSRSMPPLHRDATPAAVFAIPSHTCFTVLDIVSDAIASHLARVGRMPDYADAMGCPSLPSSSPGAPRLPRRLLFTCEPARAQLAAFFVTSPRDVGPLPPPAASAPPAIYPLPPQPAPPPSRLVLTAGSPYSRPSPHRFSPPTLPYLPLLLVPPCAPLLLPVACSDPPLGAPPARRCLSLPCPLPPLPPSPLPSPPFPPPSLSPHFSTLLALIACCLIIFLCNRRGGRVPKDRTSVVHFSSCLARAVLCPRQRHSSCWVHFPYSHEYRLKRRILAPFIFAREGPS